MRPIEPLESRRLLASFAASSVAELIGGINAANAAGGSNSITLTPGITFNLIAADNATHHPTGLPVVAAGNDLTIAGNGDIIQRSTARGTPDFRLFDVAAGASLSLNNLTLSGGVARFYGGAVVNLGTLSLTGVTVQNCAAKGWSSTSGGGIYSYGQLTVADSTIRSNQVLGDNGVISGWVAQPGGRAYGGGLYVAGGTATVTNSTFTSNLAHGGNGANGMNLNKGSMFPGIIRGAAGGDAFGGGIYVYSGANVTLRGTTITQNSAIGGAGGSSPGGQPKAPNGSGYGGGIYIDSIASVGLDAFTRANTRTNTASTSDNDIFGSFTLLA
jgi:hypothetical protein